MGGNAQGPVECHKCARHHVFVTVPKEDSEVHAGVENSVSRVMIRSSVAYERDDSLSLSNFNSNVYQGGGDEQLNDLSAHLQPPRK